MSALGHKRTYAVQKGMSALPPKADMCGAITNVRLVPIADIAPAARSKMKRPPTEAASHCEGATFTYVKVQIWDLPANWRRISAVKSEQAWWQFYDLSAPEDPAFGSIAAMIAAWTFWSCAVTAAVSDNRRCRVS